ncbi:exported hypothetical protein [Candidatus Sulfotelmatomonas gaucii]|uniref:Uncharacterized protein n=1 Tax=Candidatus Sulfuritelmatomonas gaucii TaxID=2043161 RepID=A0A2N9L7I5_9BACT|nr:exported hypothetical protein [Candidatus Sulfotelmatomonas gaucii]
MRSNFMPDPVARVCRAESAFHILATNLLVFFALLFLGGMTPASAQDAKPAPPPAAPSAGKALVFIYRRPRQPLHRRARLLSSSTAWAGLPVPPPMITSTSTEFTSPISKTMNMREQRWIREQWS